MCNAEAGPRTQEAAAAGYRVFKWGRRGGWCCGGGGISALEIWAWLVTRCKPWHALVYFGATAG